MQSRPADSTSAVHHQDQLRQLKESIQQAMDDSTSGQPQDVLQHQRRTTRIHHFEKRDEKKSQQYKKPSRQKRSE